MQSVMLNIFDLIKNFLDIINNKLCLFTCEKYYSSSLNDAHIIYPADIVSPPAKVILPTTFFSKRETIFVQLLCWPLVG